MKRTEDATMTNGHRDSPGMRIPRKPPPDDLSGNPATRGRSGRRPPARHRVRAGARRSTVRTLRGAVRAFLRGEHGGVAIESSVAVMVLVLGFGVLMEIVHASYTDDRMGRAARAAARALALDPTVGACAPIRRELRLADDFDCNAEWTVRVDLGVAPNALPATLDADATAGSGDMVLVRIGWSRDALSFGAPVEDANADDDIEDADDADAGTVPMVALGLARCEAELCGWESP